jgi:chromosome partitioning protein
MSEGLIVVSNLKGGTGKSTVAVNLACALKGYLLDADLQGTSSAWLEPGLLPIEGRNMPILGGEVKPWLKEVFKIPQRPLIIDLPSNLGPNTAAALAVADLAVVPVTPSPADILATRMALELLRESRRRRGGRPHCLLVPAKVDMRTRAGRELADALADLDEPVGPRLGQRTAHVEAFAAGLWVGEYAPKSLAHQEIMALSRAVKKRL